MVNMTVKKINRKTRRILRENRKKLYQTFLPNPHQKSILFIVGCQRSGTTLMQKIFDKDLNTRVYGEFSELSSNDNQWGIRLNSPELVEKEFSRVKAPFIVVKPLVESQNVLRLLDYFENSKALWIFRNYKDVALSNIRHFGLRNGISDLRHIVNNEPGNWRAEKLPENMMNIVLKYFSENMNPYDAAVLFWVTRNSHFFELGLDKQDNVLMCNYKDLVTKPDVFIRYLYRQVGQEYPGQGIIADIHSSSLRKGAGIELSPEVEKIAQAMLERLEVVYRSKIESMKQ